MTSWIPLAVGALLVGLLIGRVAVVAVKRRQGSTPEPLRVSAFQGWLLLGYGIFIAVGSVVSSHSRNLNIVLAVVLIPMAIAILINNRRSRASR